MNAKELHIISYFEQQKPLVPPTKRSFQDITGQPNASNSNCDPKGHYVYREDLSI